MIEVNLKNEDVDVVEGEKFFVIFRFYVLIFIVILGFDFLVRGFNLGIGINFMFLGNKNELFLF